MVDWEVVVHHLVEATVFGILGLALFALAFFIVHKISPFSIRKELEEDQNVALGIVLGSVILGVALIVAAVVRG